MRPLAILLSFTLAYFSHHAVHCAVFDGRGAHESFPASEEWSLPAKGFTLSFTFCTTQRTEWRAMLASARTPDGTPAWRVYLGFPRTTWGRLNGPFCVELWNGPDVYLRALDDVSDGAWHRVELAYQNGQAALAIDGNVQGVIKVEGPPPSGPLELTLGANANGGDAYAGSLDDLAMRPGVSRAMRRVIELHAQTTLLSRREVDANYDAWAERLYRVRPFPADTLEPWKERRMAVREHVQRSLGLSPWPYTKDQLGDQLPLDVRLGEKRDFDDFSVQGVAWQSWRGVYGRGWLYLPKTGKPPYPAILNLNGHFQYEGRDPVEQSRCMALAKLGYIALEVNSVHPENLAAGVTPLSGMIWNDLRALDYLASRPDVDTRRIGCTGASGGGQRTFYLMGLDERIDAAVPVALPTFFKELSINDERKPWRVGTHCNCNYVCGLLSETDCPEVCAVFAPRPALFISNELDWTRMWPREGHPEVAAVYKMYGAERELELLHDSRPHGYPQPWREAMYAFFNRRFMHITDLEKSREPERLPILSVEAMSDLLPELPEQGVAEWTAALTHEFVERHSGPADLRALFGYDDPEEFAPSENVVGEERYGKRRMRLVRYRTEPEIDVPALLLSSARGKENGRIAILTGEAGKAATLLSEDRRCSGLLAQGWSILIPDLRYTGELTAVEAWYKAFGTLTGRTQAAAQLHDLLAIVRVLRESGQYAPDGVVLIGIGNAAVPVALAGAIDARVAAIAGCEVGANYSTGRTRPWCDQILLAGDLPGVLQRIAPRPVYWSETPDRRELLRWLP